MNLLINFFFIRKVKFFNKNRYSRIRQVVKPIFYFALYVNIIVIYYVFSVFYGYILVLSYHWFIFIFFIFTFIINYFMYIIYNYEFYKF